VNGQFSVIGDSSNTQFALQNTAIPAGYDLLADDNLADVYFDNKTGSFRLDAGGGADQVEVLLTNSNSGLTSLTLAGGTGNDRFGTLANPIQPLPTLPILIDGNDPVISPLIGNAAAGDELWLDVTALPGPVLIDTSTGVVLGSGGLQPVAYNSIEIMRLIDDGALLPGFEMGDVYLGLTNQSETIVVSKGPSSAGPGALAIRVNSAPIGTVSPTRRLTINAAGGVDRITVSSGALAGGNTLPALQGFDFYGGPGNDYLAGGAQHDRLFGGDDNDIIIGGLGNDFLDGGTGNDKMDGGAGDDVMLGDLGNDSMTGNTGNDVLYGGEGVDTLAGVAGDDRLYGGGGNDNMNGGLGNDLLDGGAGNDRLLGSSGLDVLIGGAGADNLNGGNEDDILLAGRLSVDLTAGGTTTESTLPADAYDQVLAAVLAAWSTRGLSTGRPFLSTTGVTTALGSTRLDFLHMLTQDNVADTLVGGSAADWIVLNTLGTTAARDKATLDGQDFLELDA
jgi:Ca2+-binding RTX toxin-like protein